MSLSGSVQTLRSLAADLRRLPRAVALKVTAASAQPLTALARETFSSGEDPYGITWAPGAEGQHVTLRKSGSLQRYIQFVAVGTILRVALGVRYAKYQVGKRPIFPRAGAPVPDSWARTFQRIAVDVVRAELGGPR